MSVLQIFGAIGLYIGLFLLFVIILILAAGSSMYASTYHYNRGNILAEEGQYDQATQEFTKAIEINPMYIEAYLNRGAAYIATGRYDEALSDFNKVIEIEPEHAEAYKNRGIAFFHKKEYDNAWENVHKAQSLGYEVPPDFLKTLREASGRKQ